MYYSLPLLPAHCAINKLSQNAAALNNNNAFWNAALILLGSFVHEALEPSCQLGLWFLIKAEVFRAEVFLSKFTHTAVDSFSFHLYNL